MGPARAGGLGSAAATMFVTLVVALAAFVMVLVGGGFHHPIATARASDVNHAPAHPG